MCATNRVPLSYELTAANVAEVNLTEELLAEADLGVEAARRLLGDLAYRSGELEESLAEAGILLVTERADQRGKRQQVEIALASLKVIFGIGETGDHAGGSCHQDRGEDLRLYLRLPGQPSPGASAREDQGLVGVNLTTLI